MSSRRLLLGAAAVSVAALSVRYFAVPDGDDVSAAEIVRRRAALAAALPLRLQFVPASDQAKAIAATALPPNQRDQLLIALASRPFRLAWLPVFDSDVEDGDMIRIKTIGLLQTVRLTKQPIAVPVLLAPGGLIHITGVDQGLGGGVTLGIVSDHAPLKLPPLAVGETIALPAVAASP